MTSSVFPLAPAYLTKKADAHNGRVTRFLEAGDSVVRLEGRMAHRAVVSA